MSNELLKTEKVQLRLTPLERDYLNILASRQQMTISEYIRLLLRREVDKAKL